MKKSIILLCLLCVQSISFSQKMEVTTDVRGAKGVPITSESTLINDDIFSSIGVMQSISVTNLKTNKKIEKKVYDLDSKVHNLSLLRKNYRDLIEISQSRVVDGNAQFLIQSMGKEDKVNISRITLDNKLNVVDEKLLLSYDLAHTQASGPVRTDRTFKYDEQLGLYFFGEYHSVPRKDDYLRAVVFNSEMEITSDNGFNLENRDTELDPSKGFGYVGTVNILDAETVLINLQGTLFRIKNNTFTPVPLNLKKSIDSYKIHSNGKGGIRFIGCYSEDKTTQGFAVIDFDSEMNVTYEKFQNISEKINASQKEITGNGFNENLKSRSFYIRDFNVNADGTTDIVLSLRSFTYLNFSIIKINAEAKVIDQLAIPYGTRELKGWALVFEKGKIIIVNEDSEDWFDDKGEFNSEGFPNRKSDNYILTAIIVPSKDFSSFTRRQIQVDNISLSEFDSKTQKLKFYDLKLEDGTYLMNVGLGSWRSGFTAQYLGKIKF